MEYILTLILVILEGTAVIMLYMAWMDWKTAKPRFWPALALFVSFMLIFAYMYKGPLIVKALFAIPLITFCSFAFWKGNLILRGCIAIMYYALNSSMECLVYAAIWRIAGIQYDTLMRSPVFFTLFAVLNKLLLLGVTAYLCGYVAKCRGIQRSRNGLIKNSLPALGLLMFSLVFVGQMQQNGTVSLQLFLILLYFVSSTIVYAVQSFSDEAKNQLYQTHEQELLRQNKAQRALLHDSTNFSLTLQQLLQHGRQQEALQLVDQMLAHCGQAPQCLQTDNPVADAVLNEQCAKAAAQGIQLHVELCSLKNLALQELEIVVLFSNLLDNARSACMECDQDRRLVIQAAACQSGQISLTVRNTCRPGPQKPRAGSVSFTAPLHGYGLQNIRRVLKKYDCEYAAEQADGWYRVFMLLPCK